MTSQSMPLSSSGHLSADSTPAATPSGQTTSSFVSTDDDDIDLNFEEANEPTDTTDDTTQDSEDVEFMGTKRHSRPVEQRQPCP